MKIHSENIDTSINKNVRCESECVVPLRKEYYEERLNKIKFFNCLYNTNEFSASKLTLMSLRNEKN